MDTTKDFLKKYFDSLNFIVEGTDENAFAYSLAGKKAYFTGTPDKKYKLPPMTENYYTLSDLMSFWRIKGCRNEVPDPSSITNPDKVYVRDFDLLCEDGRVVPIRSYLKLLCGEDGKPSWIIGKYYDDYASNDIDSETELSTEKRLLDDLKVDISSGVSGALVIMGIDDMKSINTKYGRTFGTGILHFVASVLKKTESDSVNAYRLDGDKFALKTDNDKSKILSLHERINREIESQCTISAGVAFYAEGDDVGIVYQSAENAMDRAKFSGKANCEFYTEELLESEISSYTLREELRNSISNGFEGFYLNFQPQISGKNFEIIGAESLLRYTSPSRGFVGPDEFIPVIEQIGLIPQVGKWVLEQALTKCAYWRRYLPDIRISVNVSYLQLKEDDFVEQILGSLKKFGLPGNCLTLELTESIQLQNFNEYNKLFKIFEAEGIDIAIDDFGTGYSSLSYLKSIDIDEVKIDRCFIVNIQRSAYNYRLLNNTVDLAHSVQIRVCCEGVETEEELMTLMQAHPDVLQGYLFSKPLSEEAFENKYINSESEEYIRTVTQKKHYQELERQICVEDVGKIEKDILRAIVDNMEEMVYVCAGDDGYDMVYLNSAGCKKTGVYEYIGKKCYEVMMNRTSPCELCRSNIVSNGDMQMRKVYNQHLDMNCLLRERSIIWRGERAHLTFVNELKDENQD